MKDEAENAPTCTLPSFEMCRNIVCAPLTDSFPSLDMIQIKCQEQTVEKS